MEPVGAHGLAPIAADLDGAVVAGLLRRCEIVDPQGFARCAGERRARVFGLGVDAVVTGQLDRPAIVIELPREEERVGIAVAFCRRVTVVLVGADRMQTESTVGRRVDRQAVVVAHHHRLAVAHHQQFWRQRTVEGPHRVVVLRRHRRVETRVDTLGGAIGQRHASDVVIQAAGAELTDGVMVHLHAVTQATIETCTGLRGFVGDLRVELVPALMRPAFSGWPTFGGRADVPVEVHLDLRLPRVAVDHVGELAGERR
ncbi:hypothetical protein D3C87_1187080 [compost metagenome]